MPFICSIFTTAVRIIFCGILHLVLMFVLMFIMIFPMKITAGYFVHELYYDYDSYFLLKITSLYIYVDTLMAGIQLIGCMGYMLSKQLRHFNKTIGCN